MANFFYFLCNFWHFCGFGCDTDCPACVYCSREQFPIPVTYVYIIYGLGFGNRLGRLVAMGLGFGKPASEASSRGLGFGNRLGRLVAGGLGFGN